MSDRPHDARGRVPADGTSVLADAAAALPTRRLVLVVDDSADMRALLSDVLSERGYDVVMASSGGRALSLMAERRPDLVITDLLMPGMSGFTLRAEMLHRLDLAHVPVIVLSAFWQRPSETLDVVDVFAKPIDLDRLLEVVSSTLTDEDGSGTNSAVEGRTGSAAARGDTQGRKRGAGRIQQEA